MNLTDNKNIPFAAYDIAVYIPTGIVTVYSFYVLFLNDGMDSNGFFAALNSSNIIIGFVSIILFLSLSYMTGHIVSFLSAYLIERYIQSKFGYPSKIWNALEENPDELPRDVIYELSRDSNKIKWELSVDFFRKNLYKILIFLFHIPNSILTIAFLIIKPANFMIPKIPKGGKAKIQEVIDGLKISDLQVGDSRWEKILEHYVANNCNSSFKRMYNYLIIYGALRSIALISICANWTYIYMIFSNSKFSDSGAFHASSQFKIPEFGVLLVAFVFIPAVSWLSMLAFAKFNRRFFEEGILAILTDGKN